MKTVLFTIPLKDGCLAQYKSFLQESLARDSEYREMLQRYDIHSAKVWCNKINNKDYVFVYHAVGPDFEEKMKQWDHSDHPFDVWFRESIMAVYDINGVADMQSPEQLADFS